MEPQEIHTVVLQEEDLNQVDVDNEETDAIEYAEITSEAEDEDMSKGDGDVNEEEEEDEESTMIRTVPFEKVGRLGICHCWSYYCFH